MLDEATISVPPSIILYADDSGSKPLKAVGLYTNESNFTVLGYRPGKPKPYLIGLNNSPLGWISL